MPTRRTGALAAAVLLAQSLALAGQCALTAAPAATPAEGAYPLAYPPRAVVRMASPETVAEFAKHGQLRLPFMVGLYPYWDKIPGLGEIEAGDLLARWQEAKGGSAAFFLLPPLRLGDDARFLLRVETPDDTRHDLGLYVQEASRGKLLVAEGKGALLVSADAALLKEWQHPPSERIHTDKPWKRSLERMLTRPDDGLALWVAASAAEGALLAHTGFDLREGVDRQGWTPPVALEAGCRVLENDVRLRLALLMPSEDGAGTNAPSATGASPAAAGDMGATLFPDAQASFSVNVRAWRERARPTGPHVRSPLWQSIRESLAVASPELALQAEATLDALQRLTGVHLADDFLPHCDGRLHGAIWANNGHRAAALTLRIREPEALAAKLHRALAWMTYLSTQEGTPLRFEPTPTVGFRLGGVLRLPGLADGVELMLDEEWLILAYRTPASALARRLEALPKDAANAASLARYRFAPTPALASLLAGRVRWAALLTPFLQMETGRLDAEDDRLRLLVSGAGAPLATAAAGYVGGRFADDRVEAIVRGMPAEEARSRLRWFLQAEQIYKHLDLGRYNGRPGAYAPTLSDLIEGKGEDGTSLEAFFSRLFDPPPELRTPRTLLFADLVRALARDKALYGYRYLPVTSMGGVAPDWTRTWACVAAPVDDKLGPACVLYADGALYEKADGAALAAPVALPADRGDGGWTLRE